MNTVARMKELIEELNKASKAYYQEDKEIISNAQFDKLYDELEGLEKETGMIFSNSPTIHVGYEVLSQLEKEKHSSKMLSLDKTKDVIALKEWLGDKKGILSWKLDGLTIVLTYNEGTLIKAVTRGNGEIGEVITSNVKVFKNVPLNIKHTGELVIRGEAVIKYSDFQQINAKIEIEEEKYRNPRNLCSGTVRQLNSEIAARRPMYFFAFGVVSDPLGERIVSKEKQIKWLIEQGFECIESKIVDSDTIEKEVENFSNQIAKNDFPSDGLVLSFDDVLYGESLGVTSKFPKDSIAFKWADEMKETTLKEIEWSPSRTGLINPIAIFEPIELEGTTVSRASVHNVSILKQLELGNGDEIVVYKANMIIPQIEDNLTRSGTAVIPSECPVCHEKTELKSMNGVEELYCMNSSCEAKIIKKFTHFVSRDAMNIDGFSEATIEKLYKAGIINELPDIYTIQEYEEEIVALEGFGKRAFHNLIKAIEKSKETELPQFIYSLGISGVGLSNAKIICKEFHYRIRKIMESDVERLQMIDKIGTVIAEAVVAYFKNNKNREMIERLLTYINIKEVVINSEIQNLADKIIVITGNIEQFANRNELKKVIENKGGKVTGSVSAKTHYLINNDATSNSSKNKKAKELGVEIISESDFIYKYLK